jgi:RNA polymerase-interacting CarD/CdnL/TRCF family regulator
VAASVSSKWPASLFPEEKIMPFKIDERVVYPGFGVGRIVGLVTKCFFEPEMQMYYEILGKRSTVWVAVDESTARGLRRLTPKGELPHYRNVLRSRPVALNQDPRQRQLDLRSQLRRGTLQDICEMVRDLRARGWHKPLGETDLAALRKAWEGLCQEWAAMTGVSVLLAADEVNAVLLQTQQTYQTESRSVEPRSK